MNRDQVRELEQLIEATLATMFRQREVAGILAPDAPLPDPRTLHLMAKAAVTVLEATEKGRH